MRQKRDSPIAFRRPPLEYAGQWVAWNKEHAKIVVHGINYGHVYTEAIAAGCPGPLMQRVLGTMFVGNA